MKPTVEKREPTLWERFWGERYEDHAYHKGELVHVDEYLRYRDRVWKLDSYDVHTYRISDAVKTEGGPQ